MMRKEDKETGSTYVAWRHILPYGGTEYLSKTTFQNYAEELSISSTRTKLERLGILYSSNRDYRKDVNTGADRLLERKLPVISNRDYVFSRRTGQRNRKVADPMLDDLTRLTPMKGSGMNDGLLLVFQ